MKKFIALLRGINVSGQKQIKMSELKLLFEQLGFENVETYIQSGNVVFSSKEKSTEKIEKKVSSGIMKEFGFEVQVFVIKPEELTHLLKNNPYIKRKKETEKLYFIFLSGIPSKENVNKLTEIKSVSEEYVIDGKYIYLFASNGYGNAKMNNNFFENKLKVSATTRNWKTITTLLQLVNSN